MNNVYAMSRILSGDYYYIKARFRTIHGFNEGFETKNLCEASWHRVLRERDSEYSYTEGS
jgi:hypothetical protein